MRYAVLATLAISLTLGLFARASANVACPIQIVHVDGGFNDPTNGDYDGRVGVSFKNISSRTVVAIKFYVQLVDAFGKVLYVDDVVSYGKYSPGVLIQPRRALNHELQTAPEFGTTNAWDVPNPYRTEVDVFRFKVAVVKFDDGGMWSGPGDDHGPDGCP